MIKEKPIVPDASSRRTFSQVSRLLKIKVTDAILGQLYMYDQSKIDYQMTFYERASYLGHYLGRRRRGLEPRVAPFHEMMEWFMALFIAPIFRLSMPVALLFGMQPYFWLPKLNLRQSVSSLHKVERTKRQSQAQVIGTPYGMEDATMLCQCDGHLIYLYGNTPFKLLQFGVTVTAFLFGLISILAMGQSNNPTSTLIGAGLALLLLLAHFPSRHGVIFDRDAQTAMLIRGWFRKPLVVPFEGIFFTSYTEDVRNFSKDLIVFSQYVPLGRKKPIRLVLNTAVGSTGYSMAQVVGAVDCFMDKNNTQAMPLSIKHSIEWHRKHKLTLWHMAWRPLPDEELPKYTAADSLYQTDLLDPKDKAFKFQLTAEGREIMRKEDILNRYLAAVWEHMSLEGIDADLKKAAEAEFGTEALEKRIKEQIRSEWATNYDLKIELDMDSNDVNLPSFISLHHQLKTTMRNQELPLNESLICIDKLNGIKNKFFSSGLITYEQYKNSFKYSKPLPESELAPKKLVEFTAAKETD